MEINKPERSLGVRQKKVLNKLKKNKGYFIEERQQEPNLKHTIRLLNARGYNIQFYCTYKRRTQHNKTKLPSVTMVYYPEFAQEVLDLFYEKYPWFKGSPNYLRCIEVPILKNLNKLGSRNYKKDQERLKKWLQRKG